jgi:uncharacterized protein YllA (UPF0747 family)
MKLNILKFLKNNKVVRNYKKISIVIACIASLSMFPQKVKEANADKSYDKFAYVDAIKTYERVVGKGYKSQDLLQKLGEKTL